MSLLDTESDRPDDEEAPSSGVKASAMNELITSIEVIKSNYATKADLAIVTGKIDALSGNQQAFQSHVQRTFATKADLAEAVYQLTWRMVGFGVVMLSAMAAFLRYL
jgi:hydroxyethylthiazole kinase-like sugar kinase family protein